MSDSEATDAVTPATELAERYARYRQNHSEWLDRNSTRLIILGVLLMPVCGIGFLLILIWGGSHAWLSILDILPRVRFSLGALFAAVVTLPIPITLFFSKPSPSVELLACVLLALWITVVAVHLSTAVRADREIHPD